ncbi:TetR/AcrR family transcriptional regulator [Terasakiella sp.]|uniref:TetR/AcrR family transcriptional regulator n=1 Tax=Terasakiella sp. TaxID=2034861 RepID=UPI003AA83ECD
MAKKKTKERIIEAADDLFYRNGFEHTSFHDIAAAVGLSRGNFYYHFKTKDDILDAVIDLRMVRTKSLLNQWQDEGQTPMERIGCFAHILIVNMAKIKLYGCPLGTLSNELAKLEHSHQSRAKQLFILFQDWLSQQFRALDCGEKSEEFALHILGRSQGAATLATVFQDEALIRKEVDMMLHWAAQVVEKTQKEKV